jgi:toxin CptA
MAIRPSRRLALGLCLAHAVAAGAGVVATMAVVPKVFLLLVVGLSCARSVYGPALLRSRSAIVALDVRDDGALSFQTRRGEWHECTLLGSSFVAPYLTVLNLKSEGSRHTNRVVIMPDSATPEEFRRLRIWLRWRIYGAKDKENLI